MILPYMTDEAPHGLTSTNLSLLISLLAPFYLPALVEWAAFGWRHAASRVCRAFEYPVCPAPRSVSYSLSSLLPSALISQLSRHFTKSSATLTTTSNLDHVFSQHHWPPYMYAGHSCNVPFISVSVRITWRPRDCVWFGSLCGPSAQKSAWHTVGANEHLCHECMFLESVPV